ncbi:ABC transporter permease [Ilumatobacter sp.]|uniref:ABC transporter permease n=1 Tax=Ilumatobacter sp. TaxID=1967498 RepID=UPI003C3E962B
MSTLAVELDPSEPDAVIEPRAGGGLRHAAIVVGVPIGAVLGAMVIGGFLIWQEGENPLAVFADVVRGVFVDNRGLQNTAVSATPLLLMGLGLAVAYRARLFTIGAEGQFVIGAVAATAFATAGGISDVPGWLLIPACMVIAAVTGALWSGISAVLSNRYNTSVVISSLLLTYVAAAAMQWLIRVGIRDDESFVPASAVIGNAGLPTVPGLNTHLGFVLAVLLVPILTVVMSRTRFGFRVDVIGHNPIALRANEVSTGRMLFTVLGLVGVLSGIAGYVQVAGVTNRINAEFSVGYGYTAIIVALLGRLHPVGVLIAALGVSGLDIGFAAAERDHQLPSSLVGVVQALLIIFVVIGDAVAGRFSRVDGAV